MSSYHHMVRMTTDPSRYAMLVDPPHAERQAPSKERIAKISGQVVRVRFYRKDGEHATWEVHPDDVARLTPNFPTPTALVYSCIVECD